MLRRESPNQLGKSLVGAQSQSAPRGKKRKTLVLLEHELHLSSPYLSQHTKPPRLLTAEGMTNYAYPANSGVYFRIVNHDAYSQFM